MLRTNGEKNFPLVPFLGIAVVSDDVEIGAATVVVCVADEATIGASSFAAGAALDPPSVDRIAITSPTWATWSFSKRILTKTPAPSEGNSLSTLSVATSTRGSSIATESPTFFNQLVMVASVTLSPILGRRISISAIVTCKLMSFYLGAKLMKNCANHAFSSDRVCGNFGRCFVYQRGECNRVNR